MVGPDDLRGLFQPMILYNYKLNAAQLQQSIAPISYDFL